MHDEWIRNVLEVRPDLTEEKLQQVRVLMGRHVPGCLVDGYQRRLLAGG